MCVLYDDDARLRMDETVTMDFWVVLFIRPSSGGNEAVASTKNVPASRVPLGCVIHDDGLRQTGLVKVLYETVTASGKTYAPGRGDNAYDMHAADQPVDCGLTCLCVEDTDGVGTLQGDRQDSGCCWPLSRHAVKAANIILPHSIR